MLFCHLDQDASPWASCGSSTMADILMPTSQARLCVLSSTAWYFHKSQLTFPTCFSPSCTQLFSRIYADCCYSMSQMAISCFSTYGTTFWQPTSQWAIIEVSQIMEIMKLSAIFYHLNKNTITAWSEVEDSLLCLIKVLLKYQFPFYEENQHFPTSINLNFGTKPTQRHSRLPSSLILLFTYSWVMPASAWWLETTHIVLLTQKETILNGGN